MSATPRITEAITIASAVFWSSSISLRTEKGESLAMSQNASEKKTMPIALKRTD